MEVVVVMHGVELPDKSDKSENKKDVSKEKLFTLISAFLITSKLWMKRKSDKGCYALTEDVML